MAMELGWIEDFLALAECGNFSRAAQSRNLTQPAFSRRIKALEEWVGAPLFDRTTSPIRATEAGLAFLPAAEETARHLTQGRAQARAAARMEVQAVTFAATHALSLTFFPPWLRRFEATAGLGAVHLISDSLRACEEVMAKGGAHFLICHHHEAAPSRLDPSRHRSTEIGRDVLVPLRAPGTDFQLDGTATPLPFLAYHEDSGMSRIVTASLHAHGEGPVLEPVFTSHLATVLQAMARDGRGIAWLPRSLAEDDMAAGRLECAALREGWDIPVEIRLIRPRARQSPQAEALWSLIAAV